MEIIFSQETFRKRQEGIHFRALKPNLWLLINPPMSPEIASCKLSSVVEITHRVQLECRADGCFSCVVFGSCDTELQQVRFQCVTVHCRWILQDQGLRVPGCSGLMQQQVYNCSHDFLKSLSCQPEVLTAETLLALQHPCPSPPVLPSPAAGPQPSQGSTVSVPHPSTLLQVFWNRLPFVSSCVVLWRVDKSFCSRPDLGPQR